jgi:hypothetical protein
MEQIEEWCRAGLIAARRKSKTGDLVPVDAADFAANRINFAKGMIGRAPVEPELLFLSRSDITQLCTPTVSDAPTTDESDAKVDRYPGRPSVKHQIMSRLCARAEEGLLHSKLAEEARELLAWANLNCAEEKGLPGTAKVVENQIRKKYKELKPHRQTVHAA